MGREERVVICVKCVL